jgi:hypothetical protein
MDTPLSTSNKSRFLNVLQQHIRKEVLRCLIGGPTQFLVSGPGPLHGNIKR